METELDFVVESESKKPVIKRSQKQIIKFDSEVSETSETSETEEEIHFKEVLSQNTIKPIIGNRCFFDYLIPNANNYHYKTWRDAFPDKVVSLRSLMFNPGWNDFFDGIKYKPYYNQMEKILSSYLDRDDVILPHAELVFNAFNVLSPKDIRVIIIGQDPYPGANRIKDKLIPQAIGFSFSTLKNYPKPESLNNIYQNLLQFNHIDKIPDTGCLSGWVAQGCFMINAALTTFYSKKNVHRDLWKSFTNDLISYLNLRCENLVFLVWGKDAHYICKYVDPRRHQLITSSHPSPLAFHKGFNGFSYGVLKNESDRKEQAYPAFRYTDHFGRANTYLKSVGKRAILWDCFL